MSADLMSTNPPEPEQPKGDSVSQKIAALSDEDWELAYSFLLQSFGINRHSNPSYQMRYVLRLDRQSLETLVDLAIKLIGENRE